MCAMGRVHVLLSMTVLAVLLARLSTASPSISSLNVLLPPGSAYTVSASDGCFSWESSDPSVAAVVPSTTVGAEPGAEPGTNASPSAGPGSEPSLAGLGEPVSTTCAPRPPRPGCTDSVVVQASETAGTGARASAWIYATDKDSGVVLRCEVFVDRIASLAVLTTTRTMYRGDAEVIEAQAFDAAGNVFNALDSLRFSWTLGDGAVVSMAHAREYGIASDSARSERGFHGPSIVLRGEATGSSEVSVRLSDSSLTAGDDDGLAAASAVMTVLEPLQLVPHLPVGLAPGTQITYKLKTRGSSPGSTLVPIAMPSPTYVWASSNPDVLHVDAKTGRATALAAGSASISVTDVNMEANRAHALVRVAAPDYLTLTAVRRGVSTSVPQASPWTLVRNSAYAVQVHVFDAADREVLVTSNMKFEVAYPTVLLGVRNTSASGSDAWVQTKSVVGEDSVSASLTRISPLLSLPSSIAAKIQSVALSGPAAASVSVSGTALVRVAHPLSLTPTSVVIPPEQHVQFVTHGGSGTFVFEASESGGSGRGRTSGFAPFSLPSKGSGLVRAGPRSGTGTLTVSDAADAATSASASVLIVDPVAIDFPPQTVETDVSGTLDIAVRVTNAGGVALTHCSVLPLRFRVTDPSLFRIENVDEADLSLASGGCYGLRVRALGEGSATLQVAFGSLMAEVALFAHPALKVVSPASHSVLVALGTSWDVVFSGGPAPWLYEPTTATTSLKASHKSAVRIEELERATNDPRGSVYRVTCLSHADVVLTYAVGNTKSASNPVPRISRANVTFACQTPHTLELAVGNANLGPQCGSVRAPVGDTSIATSYSVRVGTTTPVAASVLNDKGVVFNNASSLDLEWSVSSEDGAAAWAAAAESPSSLRRSLVLGGSPGLVEARVHIVGYIASALAGAKTRTLPSVAVSLWSTRSRLLHVLEIESRLNGELDPPAAVVFAADGNSLNVFVRHGSGHVTFAVGDERVATLGSGPSGGLPGANLVPGNLGATSLTAMDVCLVGGTPMTADVLVADVHSVELRIPSMVLLGDTLKVAVQVLGGPGHAFPTPQLAFMDVSVSVDDDAVVQVVKDGEGKLGDYVAGGLELGTVRVSASAMSGRGERVVSATHQVTVFPDLVLDPPVLDLVCGASAQVLAIGGPASHVEHVFRSNEPGVASVVAPHSGDVVGVSPGSSVLSVTASGYDAATASAIVYASASMPLRVRKLQGVRIVVTNPVLLVGSVVALTLEGSRGESPLMFAVLASGRAPHVEWTVTDGTGVLGVEAQHGTLGADLHSEADMTVLARALSAGTATVHVTFRAVLECGGVREAVEFSDSTSFTVLPALTLVEPAPCSPLLIVPPGGTACIATNRDGLRSAKLSYQVMSGIADVVGGGSGGSGGSGADRGGEAGSDEQALRVGPGATPHLGPARSGAELAVTEDGCVVAGTKMGTGLVVAMDETDGEFVTVGVRVAAVDHLAIVPEGGESNSEEAASDSVSSGDVTLPMGGTRSFALLALDELGRSLTMGDGDSVVDYDVSVSHPGRLGVSVDSAGRLHVRGAQQGSAMVRVALANEPAVVGYVRVVVGEAVMPASPRVAVGGIVEFALSPAFVASAHVDGSSGSVGWTSSDTSVLTVDATTGVAHAVSAGSAVVHVTAGSEATYTHVTVLEPSVVEVGVPVTSTGARAEVITNVASQVGEGGDERTSYRVPIAVFGGASGATLLTDSVGRVSHHLEVACVAEPRGWVLTSVDEATGECVVTPLSAAVTDLLLPSEVDQLVLTVTVGSVSASRELAYMPAFAVYPSAGVSLSKASPSAELEIFGSPSALTVTTQGASSKVALSVVANTTTSLVMAVALAEDAPTDKVWSDVEVVVEHRVTGQRARVRVLYDPAGGPGTGRRPTRPGKRINVPVHTGGSSDGTVSYDRAKRGADAPVPAPRTAPSPSDTDAAAAAGAASSDSDASSVAGSSSGMSWWYLWVLLVLALVSAIVARVCALPSMQPVVTKRNLERKLPPSAQVPAATSAPRTKGGAILLDDSMATPTRSPFGRRYGSTSPYQPRGGRAARAASKPRWR